MADKLEPIVIPPFVVDGKFTCAGAGLRYEGEERVAPDVLRTLILPSGTRNGIADRERSKAWWGAQVLFYGLKFTKSMSIAQLRTQLEDALRDKNRVLRVPQDILDAEYKNNKEFRELNAEVRAKTVAAGGKRKLESVDDADKKGKSKAKAAPTAEVSSQKKQRVNASEDQPVKETKAKPRAKKSAAAPVPMDVDAPAVKPRTKQTARKGTGIPVVPMDIDTPEFTFAFPPQAARKATGAAFTQAFNAPAASGSQPARTKQTARKSTGCKAPSKPSAAQSIKTRTDATSGYWALTCPYIADQWDYIDSDNFSLNIVANGSRLEAEFELGIFHGFLRSKTIESRASGPYVTFEWAGKERDGPVCYPSTQQTGYIKFNGHKLKGTFSSAPACGEDGAQFEGEWVSEPDPVQMAWDDYDEAAYERANRARWGGRW